jgi:hypothetical protein
MVPAPTILDLADRSQREPLGHAGNLAGFALAKNACRNATDCGERMHSTNSARSKANPSANGLRTAASTQSTIRAGAKRQAFSPVRRARRQTASVRRPDRHRANRIGAAACV